MKRTRFWQSYRSPRTLQERKRYYDDKEYCRSKRSSSRLPNAYDDIPLGRDTSWKHRRKTKWFNHKREWLVIVFTDISIDGYYIPRHNLYHVKFRLQSMGYYVEEVYYEKTLLRDALVYKGKRISLPKDAYYADINKLPLLRQ